MNQRPNRFQRICRRVMHGIATKIVLMTIVVVFIPIYWLNREAVTFFDLFNRRALESNMRNYALMIGSHYRQLLQGSSSLSVRNSEILLEYLRVYDRRMGIHIRVLDADGKVVLDSRNSGETNLGELREVRQSMTGGYAMRNALTPDRQFMNYYLAWPVKSADNERILAVVHIVQDTNEVIKAIKQMIHRQQVATWIALAAAVSLAVFLAGGITRPLIRLTKSALSFARKETRFDSGLKRRRDEIGQLDDALRLMAREINDSNSYNREFVDALQHEYVNALAGINGAVDNLKSGAKDDPSDCALFIDRIDLQTQRMLNLTERLYSLSRLGVESLRDRRQKIDLRELVPKVIDSMKQLMAGPHSEIEVNSPDKAVKISAVPELIGLVIENLVKNALRHTPPEGFVRISLQRDGEGVRVAVRDNGEGICEDNLPHIFDRFFTTVPKRDIGPRGFGHGLGLAIVKQIVEAHDGTIRCESVVGKGTEFIMNFPC